MARSRSDKEFLRVRDLTTRLLETGLNDVESRELADLLRDDPETQAWYVDHMVVHGMLELSHLEPLKAKEPAVADSTESVFQDVNESSPEKRETFTNSASCSTTFGFLGGILRQGISFLERPSVFGLFLAIGLPGIVLLVLLVDISRQRVASVPVAPVPGATRQAMAAELTQQCECVWDNASPALSVGTRLDSGRKLWLCKGLAELTFADGAKVILEGPCTFQVDSREKGFLHAGRLVAKVAKGSKGFRVQTPSATIVDLGTEFGVSVRNNGVVETHVFVGRVEVEANTRHQEPDRGTIETLDAGQAAKIQMVGEEKVVQVRRMVSTPRQFARRVPRETSKGLPEPRIIFSHQGDRNPTTEGWELIKTVEGEQDAKGLVKAGPIRDGKTLAWSIVDDSRHYGLRYLIGDKNGLTPRLRAEAKTKGWVLRARLKVIAEDAVENKPGVAYCSYWEEKRRWRLRFAIDSEDQLCLRLLGVSSLGNGAMVKIPDLSDQYVNYEMRYNPTTDDADIYIEGRYAATIRGTRASDLFVLQFGTIEEGIAKLRCAKIEWGILEEK